MASTRSIKVYIGNIELYKEIQDDMQYGVICRIVYSESGNLTIVGAAAPVKKKSLPGPGGQIQERVAMMKDFAPGWNAAMRDKFLDIWEDWHLNIENQKKVPDDVITWLFSLPEIPVWPSYM